MRIIVRGFVCGVKRFEELVEHAELESPEAAEARVQWIIDLAGDLPHMVEIEFPDDPNPMERFYRFGTDPDMMTMPIPVDGAN